MAEYSGNIIQNPSAQAPLTEGWTGYSNVTIVSGGFTDSCFRLGSLSYLEQTIPVVTFTGTDDNPVECDGVQLSTKVRFNNPGAPIYADILVYLRLQVVTADKTSSYILPCPAVLDPGQSQWYSFQKDFEVDFEGATAVILKLYTVSTDVQIDIDNINVWLILGASATSEAIDAAKTYSDYNIIAHINDISNSHLSIEQKEGLTGGTKHLRSIKLGLENSVEVANNKLYDYTDFHIQPIIVRPDTPIITPKYWQEVLVQTAANVTCTSIAVERSNGSIGKIWIAYISDNILTVKSAPFKYPVGEMVWTVEQSVPGCSQCAIEFDGTFARSGDSIVFGTGNIPYIFYTTLGGELVCQQLNGIRVTLISSNVTAFDALRASRSAYGDIDDGLVIFYIYDGVVKYSQLINGIWQGEETVTIAPTNIVKIKAERLFDYRINLHLTDANGVLWEIFSKISSAGWNGNEYVSVDLSVASSLMHIFYEEYATAEYVACTLLTESALLYALSPIMLSAVNIANEQGNYGILVDVVWDENIFNEEANGTAFTLSDDFGGAWPSSAVVKEGRLLHITFLDFNNAVGTVTVKYTPGTLTGDVASVEQCTVQFVPAGLIPTEVIPPALVSYTNIQYSEVYP